MSKKIGQDILFYDLYDIMQIERTLQGRDRKQDPALYDSLVAASRKLSAIYIRHLLINGSHLD